MLVFSLGNTDHDLVAFDFNLVRTQVDGGRGGQCLAGFDIEAGAMQRAFDLAIIDVAIRHAGIGMGADIVDGVKLTLELVDADIHTAD